MEMFWSRHLRLPLFLGNTVGRALCAKLFKYIDHCCVILWLVFLNTWFYGEMWGIIIVINLNIAAMCLVWLDNILNLNLCFPCFMQEGKGSVRTLVIMWSSSHPWDSLTRVVIDLPKHPQDTRFSFVIWSLVSALPQKGHWWPESVLGPSPGTVPTVKTTTGSAALHALQSRAQSGPSMVMTPARSHLLSLPVS